MKKDFILNILKVVLWLTAIHSFIVGILMIILPASVMVNFGFKLQPGNFFQVQGGVFHFVMVFFYILSATDPLKYLTITKLIIVVKFSATFFLLIYYLFIERIITILLSGIGDFLIGFVILLLLTSYLKHEPNGQKIS